jgi:hypothetical protein
VVSDRAHVSTEIAKTRSGINNGNTIGILARDLKTGGVAAELLEASITDWHGAAATVKFELHTELYGRVVPRYKSGALNVSSWRLKLVRFPACSPLPIAALP